MLPTPRATPDSGQAEATAEAAPTDTPTAVPSLDFVERGVASGRGVPARRGGPLIITITGEDGSTYFVTGGQAPLPVIGPESDTCGQPDAPAVEFLQDSIIVSDVALRLAYIVRASAGDDLWLIAGRLEGARATREEPIAVWATLAPGGRGLEYGNTWAANRVAAEYSSLHGGSGGEFAYGQLPGFGELQQCIRDAQPSGGPVILPGGPLFREPDFFVPQQLPTPTPERIGFYCDRPDEAVVEAIASSLNDPEVSIHSIATARPQFFVDDVSMVVAAVLEWPSSDSLRAVAVWVVTEADGGELRITPANQAAQEFSDLPGPGGSEFVPEGVPQVYQQMLECL